MPSVAPSVSAFISSVFIGSRTEPVSRKRITQGGRGDDRDHQRQVVDQALLLVDEAGGVAGDERRRSPRAGRGRGSPRPCPGRRGRPPARRARSWRRRPARRRATKGVPADDPVDRVDLAAEGGELGGAGAAVDGDGDRLGDVARVVGFDVVVGDLGGLAVGDEVGVRPGQRRPEQRRRGGEQQAPSWRGRRRPGGASPRGRAGTSRRTRSETAGAACGSRARRSACRAGPAARARRGSRSAPRAAPTEAPATAIE